MASSTNTLDQITANMLQQDVVVNANFAAASPAMGYARKQSTTAALTWGYEAATIDIAGEPTPIAAGSIALTASDDNYIYRTSAGVVTKTLTMPTGWPVSGGGSGGPITSIPGAIPLYTIVTGADSVTSYEDHRSGGGAGGTAGSADDPFVTLTDGATVTINALLGHNFYLLIGGNRTLANPTDLADGQVLTIVIKQDGTGTRTLAYGSKWKFANGANTLSTAANAVDVIGGIYHASLDLIFCNMAKAIA